jgi:hypothetical protein
LFYNIYLIDITILINHLILDYIGCLRILITQETVQATKGNVIHILPIILRKKRKFTSLQEVPFKISYDLNHNNLKGRTFNGFAQLGLTYTHQGLKETLKDVLPTPDDLVNCWPDTSFIIQRGMVIGYHPNDGVLGIYRNSFLNACYGGLLGIETEGRSYYDMKKEVYNSRNLFNIWMMNAIKQDNVTIAPEVFASLERGLEPIAHIRDAIKSKGDRRHARLFQKEFWFRKKMLDAIGDTQEGMFHILSPDEKAIRSNLEDCSQKEGGLISEVESSFLSRIIARAETTGTPQSLLTRDKGISDLLRVVDLPGCHIEWDFYSPLQLKRFEISMN